MPQLSLDQLVSLLESGDLREVTQSRTELKSDWHQDHGKDISAIANNLALAGGWVVIGVNDQGKLLGKSADWLKRTEEQISSHINQYLSPSWAATVQGKSLVNGGCVLIEVTNPGDVTEWNKKPYKLTGTVSQQMTPDEQLALSIQLPGEDFSKTQNKGTVNGALVMEFAKKLQEAEPSEFSVDLANIAPTDILKKLSLHERTAAAILFGEYKVRVVRYDSDGDILDQVEKAGTYYALSDDFIAQVQAWTRKQGTILKGQTASVTEEAPYPTKALREVLANAVAHALFHRDYGKIVIELRPNRLTVSNHCSLEAKLFTKKWFSRDTHVRNKLLMRALRTARITDEVGTGKSRIFRLMIESGKREPIVEFLETGTIGRWSITLYNEEQNAPLLGLIVRFKEAFLDPDKWRIATALVLWRENSWTEIQEKLDEHYKRVALEVIQNDASPVIVINNRLFVRRWVSVGLTGQVSKRFTEAEEEQIKIFLQARAFSSGRQGNFSTEEARKVIGLSDSQSEITQLSNLFRKWSEKDLIRRIKRGHWRFFTETERQTIVIMSLNEKANDGS
jgi:predicted HTH transcriptional regulator